MTYLIGILVCAALFLLFGLLRPAEAGRGCGGNCGVCSHACDTSEAEHAHE